MPTAVAPGMYASKDKNTITVSRRSPHLISYFVVGGTTLTNQRGGRSEDSSAFENSNSAPVKSRATCRLVLRCPVTEGTRKIEGDPLRHRMGAMLSARF